MEYHKQTTAIALSNTKQAALFFDYVVPLNFFEGSDVDGNVFLEISKNVFPPQLKSSTSHNGISEDYTNHYLINLLLSIVELKLKDENYSQMEMKFPPYAKELIVATEKVTADLDKDFFNRKNSGSKFAGNLIRDLAKLLYQSNLKFENIFGHSFSKITEDNNSEPCIIVASPIK